MGCYGMLKTLHMYFDGGFVYRVPFVVRRLRWQAQARHKATILGAVHKLCRLKGELVDIVQQQIQSRPTHTKAGVLVIQ